MSALNLIAIVFYVRYGKVFKSYVLGRFTVFMTGREASKILLTGKDGLVSLNLFYTGKQVLGPTSLLTQSGEAHKRLRRLIGEPLSMDALRKYFPFINNLAMETLDHWSNQKILVLEEASTVEISAIPASVVMIYAALLSENMIFKFAVHTEGDRPHDHELGAYW